MKRIYLNKDFQCFTSENGETVQFVETSAFDGKCKAYIEGFRFVPAGQHWIREDGKRFDGEMVSPFKDYIYLETVQSLYEEMAPQAEATMAQAVYTAMMTDTLI